MEEFLWNFVEGLDMAQGRVIRFLLWTLDNQEIGRELTLCSVCQHVVNEYWSTFMQLLCGVCLLGWWRRWSKIRVYWRRFAGTGSEAARHAGANDWHCIFQHLRQSHTNFSFLHPNKPQYGSCLSVRPSVRLQTRKRKAAEKPKLVWTFLRAAEMSIYKFLWVWVNSGR